MKNKKAKKLLVTIYPSGIVGRGKGKTKVVRSVLTPLQYKMKYYRSAEHFRTEYAMKVKKVY